MYRVSQAFSASAGGVAVGACAAGSSPFVDGSTMPVMGAEGGGAVATSSMPMGFEESRQSERE